MKTIAKSVQDREQSNLKDYVHDYPLFSWDRASSCMTGLPDLQGINMAFEAVDRHVQVFDQGHKSALRWCSASGSVHNFTYQDLMEQSNRFANGLASLGVKKGDVLFALTPRVPELYAGMLGALKHRCIFSPLMTTFTSRPILDRLQMGHGKVLLTTEELYKKRLRPLREHLPDLQHVIIADLQDHSLCHDRGLIGFQDLLKSSSAHYIIGPTSPEDPALIHFTNDTTGETKGTLHVHEAMNAHHIIGRLALDLKAGDIFWCTADPSWISGTSYGILSALSNGTTLLVDEAEFDAERWYHILDQHRVNVWYTSPGSIHRMMQLGHEYVQDYKYDALRFMASGGDVLEPDAVDWVEKAFQRPIHDNWWQMETGGIMIANFASMEVRPGSMGRPVPGVQASIMHRRQGSVIAAAPGVEGELALRTPWPSLFRAYLGQDTCYKKNFIDGWYLTGDRARMDADGYFWFTGRTDEQKSMNRKQGSQHRVAAFL